MRNQLLLVMTLLMCGATAFGQVRGVSYTIAPSASYNWFGNESGLEDAFMFGGRLGFGFGEYVELRATYMQTIDLNTDFSGLGIGVDSTFGSQGVDLRRYGAELKLNVGRGTLLPYLIIGGGIQDQEREGLDKAENIFGTLGIGLTLSAADRYAFGVEGKYIAYSGNVVRNLLDSIDQAGNPDLRVGNDNIGTFAVAANLSFYLGGRRPGQLSDIDEEYLRNFQGGLTGLSLPVELGLAQVNWDDALPYRDAYFAGGTAGFAFGPLISLRGFYYRGMTDEDLNFDFDDISLYGADFRFNLSQASSGIVPYLNVGGGYIDINSDYNSGISEGALLASSQGFASGGGGIYLKFGERIKLNGGVKALLTTGSDLEDLNSRDQITTSYMYNAGLGFTLGGNNRNNPDVVRQSTLEDRLAAQDEEFERRADSLRKTNQAEINSLRNRYQDTLARLDQELVLALEDGDTLSAREIRRERTEAAAIVDELNDRNLQLVDQQRRSQRAEVDAVLGRPVQSTAQFRSVDSIPGGGNSVLLLDSRQVDKLIDGMSGRSNSGGGNQQSSSTSSDVEQINRRVERLEDLLFQLNSNNLGGNGPMRMEATGSEQERIQQLEQRLERMRNDNDDSDLTDEQRRIRELEDEIQSMSIGRSGNTKRAIRGSSDDNDREDANERRIRELEQQLEDRRDNAGANNSDQEQRLRDLEERLNGRMSNLRNSEDDEEVADIRRSMIEDMSEYQEKMMDEIRDLQKDLAKANQDLAKEQARNASLEGKNDDLTRQRRNARLAAAGLGATTVIAATSGNRGNNASRTTTDSLGNVVNVAPGTRRMEELEVNTGGVYLADGNAEGFFSNFTYTGMSGTAGFNFGDATGLGLGLRWHYKLGPDQRAEFMPEAYFGIGAPTTFGIFGNIVYPFISENSQSSGFVPYAGLGIGAMQIKDQDDKDELNFRPAINLIVGSYLPVMGGRLFVDFSTRNFFSVSQLTGGYRFNF